MTRAKRTVDARRSRRVRTRLTRVLALAVVAPLMAGSIAYAAGVEPVRRRVDEFLKGTARLLDEAESSKGDFHLSPNPVGGGVLVMPMDDRGPRPSSGKGRSHGSRNSKEKKTSPHGEGKEKSEPSRSHSKKSMSSAGGGVSKGVRSEKSKEDMTGSGTPSSQEGHVEVQGHDSIELDDTSGKGSSGSHDQHTGTGSGPSGSGKKDSGSGSKGSDPH